jgi:predicted SprT family Zn-dependent metalloprotease
MKAVVIEPPGEDQGDHRTEFPVRLPDAKALAVRLIAQHAQLTGWRVSFTWRCRRNLGRCFYSTRTIRLSVPFVARNSAEVVAELVLHEVAHALVGPGHGHGPVWQAKATALGIEPSRFFRKGVMPPGEFQATCRACRRTFHFYARPVKERWCRCAGSNAERLSFARVVG